MSVVPCKLRRSEHPGAVVCVYRVVCIASLGALVGCVLLSGSRCGCLPRNGACRTDPRARVTESERASHSPLDKVRADSITLREMPGRFRLTKIQFRAGAAPGGTPTEFVPSSVTVVVGPNNSGKSMLLRELEQWSTGGRTPPCRHGPGVRSSPGPMRIGRRTKPSLELSSRIGKRHRRVTSENHMMIYSFQPEAGGNSGSRTQVQVRDTWGLGFGEFCRTMVMQYFPDAS